MFINNDRTVAEAANERKLREQAKERNAKLDHGTGYFKYGQSTSWGEEQMVLGCQRCGAEEDF